MSDTLTPEQVADLAKRVDDHLLAVLMRPALSATPPGELRLPRPSCPACRGRIIRCPRHTAGT